MQSKNRDRALFGGAPPKKSDGSIVPQGSCKRLRNRTTSLELKAARAIADYDMSLEGPILVGLSGGPDSMALLRYLHDRGYKVEAAHLNHLLRGEEADRDEAFVRENCQSLGIRCHVERTDVAALAAANKMGIEEAARDARYAFFERLCRENGLQTVALGHTAADNAETVLFNLARGTGIAGLAGIPPGRDNIVRPLIYCTREDIADYCIKNGIEYIIDSTNLTEQYTRNRVRSRILPEMRGLNPEFEAAVSRASLLLRSDGACLDRLAAEIAEAECADGSILLDRLNGLDEAIASRIVAMLYRSRAGQGLSFDMIRAALRLAKLAQTGKQLTLPDGWVYEVCYDTLRLKRSEVLGGASESYNLKLTPKSEINPAEGLWIALESGTMPENVYNLFKYIQVDCDKIVGTIRVRSRLDGDCVTLDGQRRTLKKFLIDNKIPREKRLIWPVFFDEAGILCFAGMRPDDRVKPTAGTKKYMKIHIKGL